jgi:hypothetical protein
MAVAAKLVLWRLGLEGRRRAGWSVAQRAVAGCERGVHLGTEQARPGRPVRVVALLAVLPLDGIPLVGGGEATIHGVTGAAQVTGILIRQARVIAAVGLVAGGALPGREGWMLDGAGLPAGNFGMARGAQARSRGLEQARMDTAVGLVTVAAASRGRRWMHGGLAEIRGDTGVT